MNRKEMLKQLKAGVHPIDLAIRKCEEILEGTGRDKGALNCALCERAGWRGCDKCVFYQYFGGCQSPTCGFIEDLTDEWIPLLCSKPRMYWQIALSICYAIKEEMIKDGVINNE